MIHFVPVFIFTTFQFSDSSFLWCFVFVSSKQSFTTSLSLNVEMFRLLFNCGLRQSCVTFFLANNCYFFWLFNADATIVDECYYILLSYCIGKKFAHCNLGAHSGFIKTWTFFCTTQSKYKYNEYTDDDGEYYDAEDDEYCEHIEEMSSSGQDADDIKTRIEDNGDANVSGRGDE